MTSTGCEAIDSVLVTVLEAPDIDLIADTSLCAGSSVNLLASGAQSYAWTPAAGLSNTTISSPTASPAQTTRYRVRFTESTGCVGEDSVLVTVNAIPVLNASADTEICAGERTNLQVTGGMSYLWFPAAGLSDPNVPNPVASPASTTRYYVQGFGPGRCFTFDSVLVRVGDTPVLSVRSDTVICLGSSVVLNASGASRYTWAPADGLSDPSAAAPVASPLTTTVYTVTGFGSTGCSTSRAVRVSVGADAGRIYIPNAFTPNGDGLNDCLQVNGGGAATVYEFAVFNRFGERVFLSRTPGECWDGTYRGQQQPAGAFAYYLIVDSPCGPAKLKGTITLIR
jgi:gliding motility-associated-like protein